MIILFSSKSGSSKKYAEQLASDIGAGCYPIDSDYPTDEKAIFFGWLRKDTVVGLSSADISRLLAVCVVGLDSDERFNRNAVADRNQINVPIYYMRGWIDRSKLNVLDKGILLVVCVMMKLKGLNEYNKPVFDAMRDGGSFFDESYLDAVRTFCQQQA